MSHENKKDSKQRKKYKDDKIELRISATEKEIFKEEAEKRNMDLSSFILTTMRMEIRGARKKGTSIGDYSPQLQQLQEKIEELEKSILLGNQKIDHLQDTIQLSEKELQNIAEIDQVHRLLQIKQFQKKTREEILQEIIAIYPELRFKLESSPGKLYTPLDQALQKLEREGKIRINTRGNITWN